jgi:UDP-N-acetylglucosamine 2-epimerase (non-hydrolysing)
MLFPREKEMMASTPGTSVMPVTNKIILVAGARPNFMKIAPIIRAMKTHSGLQAVLVHTGQHYDDNMSATFFKSLGIPAPDYNLQVGSGSHAIQTAEIMVKFEGVCSKEKPDIVLVVGDVNSTIAAGLTAKKLNIFLAHVEAGLRSGDRTMPEEINRIATDSIADYFFTTEKVATQNLLKEGHDPSVIHFVGHVMIDNLYFQLKSLNESMISPDIVKLKKKLPKKYICMTLHRPSNVDNKENLEKILGAVRDVSESAPVVFPIHPRTLKNIEQSGLKHLLDAPGIFTTQPLDYNDFLANQFLTFASNLFTNLNLTDMETCYKVFRKEILDKITIRECRFGFEPEITAKVAKLKCRIYEVGISYSGRTYEEGKKIGFKDGFRALWCIVKYNVFSKR